MYGKPFLFGANRPGNFSKPHLFKQLADIYDYFYKIQTTSFKGNQMKIRIMVLTLLSFLVSLALISCNAQAENDGKGGEDYMVDSFLEGKTNAPEFPRGLDWLNTDRDLKLSDFRGKIILLDFWTFCCINCMHVIPDLKKLEEKYAEELVVIGVHSAKFENEKETEAIRQAILRYEIEHPVVNDNEFKIWSQYGVQAWPSFVLINPKGKIIGVHSGEGIYEPFNKVIGDAVEYFGDKGVLRPGPLGLDLEKQDAPNTVLAFPGKVKTDSASNRVIITDSNNDRIIITDPDGKILEVIGSGVPGNTDGSFEEARFFHPQGTYMDGDILYIADTENHTIRKADLKTRTVTTIFGCGQQAREYNKAGHGAEICLNSPWDLLKIGDKLYIAMAGSHQLWVADLKTEKAQPFAGSSREALIDGPHANAALAQPSGITTDGKKLYFADSEISAIRSADIDPDGEVSTIIGEGLFDFGDIDGDYTVARLQHPLGVVYHDGLLYIADTYNSRIKTIKPKKRTSQAYAGTGESGYKDGSLAEANFFEPGGLSILNGKIYVADVNNHSIRVIDMASEMVSTLQLSNLDKLNRGKSEEFVGRVIELQPKKIKPGEGMIMLDFNLPEGYKYIDNAPFMLNYSSSNGDFLEFTKSSDEVSSNGHNFPLEIPARAQKGETDLEFDAIVYFCSDDSGVCMVDNLKVKVPVEINESGTSELSINIDISAGK